MEYSIVAINNKNCAVNIYIKDKQYGKECSKCAVYKQLVEFYKDNKTRDLKRADCNSCNKHNYQNIKEKIREYRKSYYTTHKQLILEYKEAYKPRRNELRQERRKIDEEYRMTDNLRRRIRTAGKSQNCSKAASTVELIGCSEIWLKLWLEFSRNFYALNSKKYTQ